jgi:hypothetical protein
MHRLSSFTGRNLVLTTPIYVRKPFQLARFSTQSNGSVKFGLTPNWNANNIVVIGTIKIQQII